MNHRSLWTVALVLLALLPVSFAWSCAGTQAQGDAPVVGAVAWGNHCGHCHNVRNPAEFSDKEWEVASLHMRVRANIPAEEADAIEEFLKSSN